MRSWAGCILAAAIFSCFVVAIGLEARRPTSLSTKSLRTEARQVSNHQYYKIKGGHVYWVEPTGTPVDSVDLTAEYGTDPATFHALDPYEGWLGSHTGVYGADSTGVYFQYELIPGTNPRTFTIVNANNAISKDGSHVYIRAEQYPQLDSGSLRFVGEGEGTFYLFSNGTTFVFDQARDRLKIATP